MEMKIKTEKHTQRDTHTCTLMRRGTVYSTYLKCLQVANNKSNERKRIIKCKESVRACVCVCFSLSCTSACVCVRLSASLTGCTTACVCVLSTSLIVHRESLIGTWHSQLQLQFCLCAFSFHATQRDGSTHTYTYGTQSSIIVAKCSERSNNNSSSKFKLKLFISIFMLATLECGCGTCNCCFCHWVNVWACLRSTSYITNITKKSLSIDGVIHAAPDN